MHEENSDVWIRSNGRRNTDVIDGCMNRHPCIAFRGIFKRHRGFSKPVFFGSFFPLSALRCRSSSSSLPLLRSTKGASIGAGFPRHSFCFLSHGFRTARKSRCTALTGKNSCVIPGPTRNLFCTRDAESSSA